MFPYIIKPSTPTFLQNSIPFSTNALACAGILYTFKKVTLNNKATINLSKLPIIFFPYFINNIKTRYAPKRLIGAKM